MIRLTKRQLLILHKELVTETGGAAGIRDEGLLDSALAAPFQSFEGHTPYPSLQQKAARLGYGLVKNYPFVDGNKRIGAHAMLVFLLCFSIGIIFATIHKRKRHAETPDFCRCKDIEHNLYSCFSWKNSLKTEKPPVTIL